MALDKDRPSAAVSATIGKARVLGLIIDRREVGDVGAFDDYDRRRIDAGGGEDGARTGHCRAAFGRGRQQEAALGRGSKATRLTRPQ